ncbi:MAG: hypothetical protein OEY89_05095 [Gammaproteobacteria bacterium]|nr:hypothetical protein [Gammaproteobacteria bacterium]
MKALIKSRNEPGIGMETVAAPEITTNEALIKIHKTGIFGTDLHTYNWDNWVQSNIHYPALSAMNSWVKSLIWDQGSRATKSVTGLLPRATLPMAGA